MHLHISCVFPKCKTDEHFTVTLQYAREVLGFGCTLVTERQKEHGVPYDANTFADFIVADGCPRAP